MLKLRNYQKEAVQVAVDHLLSKSKHVPIEILPTAGGKSLVIAKIAQELQKEVLVIQPSVELIKQNYAKFLAYGGVASLYSASVNEKEVGDVTFATIGSLKNKAYLFKDTKYILIDECHRLPPKGNSMFVEFLRELPNVRVLGLTATGFRMKKYRHPFTGEVYSQINLLPYERPHFFNKFIFITQIKELYEQGHLTPVRYIPLNWDNSTLKVNTTGADYTDDSIEKALIAQEINKRLPAMIRQALEKGRKQILVFVNSVKDAEELTGITPHSNYIEANTNKKVRAQIIEDYKAGKIKTLYNVGTLTEGFDCPQIDCVIMARPTMSLSLYMQIIGRGIRLYEGKVDCAFVDMCGNIERFGHIEDITYKQDEKEKWYLSNGERKLSGVPLK